MNNLRKIATWGPIGFLPAPGTIASFLSVFVAFFISRVSISLSAAAGYPELGMYIYLAITLMLLIFHFIIVHKVIPFFVEKDPSAIIVDEFIGVLITFFFVPLNYKTVLLGFCLFRYFDISKNLGISYLEKLPGAWGIMLDDTVAGLISCGFLHIFLYYGLA